MKIACLSGKGGAGKTFVAVNLAATARNCTYIDCDVEEPNGRLFFKPDGIQILPVNKMMPFFDAKKCDGCKVCVEACRFHALMYVKEKPRVFSEVCHSCGLCQLVCPQKAVMEMNEEIGRLEIGFHDQIKVVSGILNPKQASGVAVIHKAIKQASGLTFLDCPPGSACSSMESIMDADYCILVVEPTAFGFHNFKMVYELAVLLNKPCGVIINKQQGLYEPLESFCAACNLPILERFDFDYELAKRIADNEIVVETMPQKALRFQAILNRIGVSS